MVFHPVLENKAVQKWLGDIMPVWTLLDNESFFALQHPPSRDGAAIQLATDLNIEEINQSPIARNAIILLRAGATSPGLKLTATGNLSRKVVAELWDVLEWPGFDKETTLRLCKVINELARIIHQELADVVYPFEISYDFVAESQNPRIQRPHPPWWKLPHLCPACHLFLARR
jgi:hypothetical protein